MAAGEVGQNQQTTFADPQNGTSPIDANEVTANDNALRGKFNTHDADSTIHVQSSVLASRPAFGTAGRKWMTRDSGVVRLFYDTGSAWEEVGYIATGSNACSPNKPAPVSALLARALTASWRNRRKSSCRSWPCSWANSASTDAPSTLAPALTDLT